MRITGGKARGILLEVPQGNEVRPATDFSRERIFNCISSDILETTVWDCFAGTGAYGLEALSRGAKTCFFFEKNNKVASILKKNCDRVYKSAQLDCRLSTHILNCDVFLISDLTKFVSPDYIFFDPPYRLWEERNKDIFSFLDKTSQLFPKAIFAIEYPSQLNWPETISLRPIYPTKSTHKTNAPTINLFKRFNF